MKTIRVDLRSHGTDDHQVDPKVEKKIDEMKRYAAEKRRESDFLSAKLMDARLNVVLSEMRRRFAIVPIHVAKDTKKRIFGRYYEFDNSRNVSVLPGFIGEIFSVRVDEVHRWKRMPSNSDLVQMFCLDRSVV